MARRGKHAAPKTGTPMAIKAPAAVAVSSLAMSSLAIVAAAPANAATVEADATALNPVTVDSTLGAEVVNAHVAVSQYVDARAQYAQAEASRSKRISNLQSQVSQARAALQNSQINGKAVIGIANNYQGVPYVYGGSTPHGFDCSGYTQYVFGQMGLDIPRVAASQANWAQAVSHSNARAGDLVFFHSASGYVYHVGIYAGNGKMWHAPHPGTAVRLANLYSGRVTFGRAPQSSLRPALVAHLAKKVAELSATKKTRVSMPKVKLRVVKPIATATYVAPHSAE